MDVLTTLQNMGGEVGGRSIYFAAKQACQIANWNAKSRTLWPSTRCRLRKLFPALDLRKVRFSVNCSLPGNWFTSAGEVEGMTFGYHIYFKHSHYQKSISGLKQLIHELVHVDQVRRYGGEYGFAAAYGREYLNAGSYRQNRLEREAYDFLEDKEFPDACYYNGAFYRATANDFRIEEGSDSFNKSWDHIVPGHFSGDNWTDLFFYEKSKGLGRFYRVDPDKGFFMKEVHQSSDFRRSWDIIVPGSFGGVGRTDLFFYDRKAGKGSFNSVEPAGSHFLKELKVIAGFSKAWDIIVPGQFGGTGWTDLFFYDRKAGKGSFNSVEPAGANFLKELKVISGFSKNWDIIVPGRFGGSGLTDLFFYDRSAGKGSFNTVAQEGEPFLKELKVIEGFRKGWESIIPGHFFSTGGNTNTQLLFYDRKAGYGEINEVRRGPSLKRVWKSNSFRTTWDQIVPGNFAGDRGTDLFYYERVSS